MYGVQKKLNQLSENSSFESDNDDTVDEDDDDEDDDDVVAVVVGTTVFLNWVGAVIEIVDVVVVIDDNGAVVVAAELAIVIVVIVWAVLTLSGELSKYLRQKAIFTPESKYKNENKKTKTTILLLNLRTNAICNTASNTTTINSSVLNQTTLLCV